jgi:hypothetical protein
MSLLLILIWKALRSSLAKTFMASGLQFMP